MKGPMVVVLVAMVTLVSANTATAALFSDDFEGYLPDNPIHGQGGWAGWDNNAIAGAAPVSTAQAFSGSQSLEIGGPDTDLVQVFTGATSGEWVFETMLYIPSGGSGGSRFIMLNGYTHDAGDPRYYATDIEFNLGSGTITRSGADGVITPDTWVNLRLDVDLDTNTYAAFYGGEVLFTDATWASNGLVEIQALDLWAAGASSIYYDDVSLSAVPVLTWTNAAGTNKWNEANWSGATPPPPPPDAPNATIAAVIGETSLATPVNVAADASAYSLTMAGVGDWSQVIVGADKSLNITTKLDAADGLNLIQLNNNATLNTGYGSGGLFLLWTMGNATVKTGGSLDVAFFEDTEGTGGVLTKQGAGTLSMVNSDDNIVAAQTTFRVEQGTLTLGGTDPLRGSDGTMGGGCEPQPPPEPLNLSAAERPQPPTFSFCPLPARASITQILRSFGGA